MTVYVVVEVAPGAAALSLLLGQPIGPVDQRFVGIAAMIFARRALEADVCGAPAVLARRLQSLQMVRDEPCAVAGQRRQHYLVVPALEAELDHVLRAAGQ